MMYSKFKELKARYAIAATLKVAKVAEDRISEILDYVFSKFEGYEKVAKSVNAAKFIKLYNQHKDSLPELWWMVGENEGSSNDPDFNVDETQVIVVFESIGKRDLVIVVVYEPNGEEYLDYFLQYEMKDDYEW